MPALTQPISRLGHLSLCAILWGRALGLLLLFLLGACASPSRDWCCQQKRSLCPDYVTRRVQLDPCNEAKGLVVTWDLGPFPRQLSVATLHRKLPTYQGCWDKTRLEIWIDGEGTFYEAERLLGGQKALLPGAAQEQLLEALMDGKSVEIKSRWHQELLCSGSLRRHLRLP